MQQPDTHSKKVWAVRSLRIAMMLAAAGALVFFIIKGVLFITSGEAIINAEIISLRSPIIGELRMTAGVHPGLFLSEGSPVFTVTNPRFGNLESFSQSNSLQNSIDVVEHELRQYLINRELYARNYDRMKDLIDQGGVSRQEFETAKNALDAVNAAIARKREQLGHLQERYVLTRAQLELQKEAVVPMTASGVVWALIRKEGEYLDSNDEVVQTLRPEDVWVEAFFSERYASKIRSGMMVTVREFGSKRKWQGSVAFVRSGVGRISYSAPVAIPPQKLKERLIAVRIKVKWDSAFAPDEFYGVGRSVEVTICR